MSVANVLARFGAKLNLNSARFSRRSQNSFGIWKFFENNRKRRLRLLNFMCYLIMRKKTLLQILLSLICMLQSFCLTLLRNRSCRRFLRNPGWWTTVWNNYSESRFKKTFRVSRKTFQNILQPISKRNNQRRTSITRRKTCCLFISFSTGRLLPHNFSNVWFGNCYGLQHSYRSFPSNRGVFVDRTCN